MFRNSTRPRRLIVQAATIAIAWAWFGQAPAAAQAPATQEPSVQEPSAKDKGDSQGAPDGKRGSDRKRGSGDPRETLAKLQELRLTMHKELELSAKQRDTAEKLFEDYFKRAPERYAEDIQQKQEELQTQAAELRTQMDRAAKSGDVEEARRLRKAHAELFRNAFRSEIDATGELLTALRDSLDAAQRKKFDALLRKLGLSPAGTRSRTAASIGQQLRNPELGITDNQRETIDRLTKDAMDQLGDPDLELPARREILVQLRADILSQLTDEQVRQIEEDMERHRERRNQKEKALEQIRKQKEAAKEQSDPPKID